MRYEHHRLKPPMIRRLKQILVVFPLGCSLAFLLAACLTYSIPLMLYKSSVDRDYDRAHWIVLQHGLLGVGESQDGVRARERARRERTKEMKRRVTELDQRVNELIRTNAP